MVTYKKIVFLLFAMLLTIIIVYKFNSNYLTPDETFFLLNDSIFDDSTVSTRYKFIAYIFRVIYSTGGFILLLLINIALTYFIFKQKNIKNHKLLNGLYMSLLFPSVFFYGGLFLRDYFIFLLVVFFLNQMYGKGNIKISLLILMIIAFLKIELSLIIVVAMLLSSIKIRPLFILLSYCFLLIFWFIIMQSTDYLNVYITMLDKFEPTVFQGFGRIYLGLQQLDPTPFNSTLNLLYSYFNLFTPFLICWPADTSFAFNVLMTIDSAMLLTVLLVGILFFNKVKYQHSNLYRMSVYVIILSVIYGYFMVVPMTSLRMHIHFIPFLIVLFSGSRLKA